MSKILINIKCDDKILIIAPHPDDECIGCGGLLSLYPEKCSVVVMTDGSQGNINVVPEQEAIIRKNQFINEMKFAGIDDYTWLGFADGTLMSIKDCAQNIQFENYTKIFLPWRDDNHPDHTAAFLYSLNFPAAYLQYVFPLHTASEQVQCTSDGHIHPALPQFF